MTSALADRRVLVVEDDYFLAVELARDLSAGGAEVVGPAASMDAARLDLVDHNEVGWRCR